MVFAIPEALAYFVPLEYAPKLLYKRGRWYDLTPRLRKEMRRSILLDIEIAPQTRRVMHLDFLQKDGRPFIHYHGTCLGDYRLPVYLETDERVLEVASEIEKLMEVVNADSPMNFSPIGLPTLTHLKRACRRENGWAV
jgi:hypothetical protein